jgi:membrane protease YdiL (CAAX protease family)
MNPGRNAATYETTQEHLNSHTLLISLALLKKLQHALPFLVGVLFELALLVIALVWDLVFGESILRHFRWRPADALAGAISSLPLFVFFVWTLKSKLQVFARHRQVLDSLVPRLFAGWPVWQWAAISLCAGVCEEVLFRGALQSGLATRVGSAPAVIVVSLLFGALHLLSWTYGIIAGLIGVYLGVLFLVSGNLLAPVMAHAVYDFAAIFYFLKIYRQTG